jgi:hypothetical protein
MLRGMTMPQTIAVRGSSFPSTPLNSAMRRSTASGASEVSASMASVNSVVMVARAKFSALALEPQLRVGRMHSTPWSANERATSPVSSVEQSSTTMMRSGRSVWASTDRIVSATNFPSLYAGIITVRPVAVRRGSGARASRAGRGWLGFGRQRRAWESDRVAVVVAVWVAD